MIYKQGAQRIVAFSCCAPHKVISLQLSGVIAVTMLILTAAIALSHILLATCDCPAGFTRESTGAACYKFNAVDKNHADAAALCASNSGSVLPMFRNQNDLNNFRSSMSVNSIFHLGANSIAREGVWVQEVPTMCKPWIPWDAGQPQNGAEKCAALYHTNNKVHDYPCTTAMDVLCQIRIFEKGCGCKCPSGFTMTAGRTFCYKFNSVKKNHADAQALCASQSGSVLPMFRNQKDIDDLKAVMTINSMFHLGSNANARAGVWVQEKPDYCSNPFLPWDTAMNQPQNGAERCPVMFTSNKVHDYPCTHTTSLKVLCQVRNFGEGCGCQCPAGFTMTKSRTACYKFNNVDKSHADARALCHSQGGSHLPIFRNKQDLDDMRAAISVSAMVHLGANATVQAGLYVTEHPDHCRPWLPWDTAMNQPQNGAERCPIMFTSNKVHDYPCSHTTSLKVVCQARLFGTGCGSHCPAGFTLSPSKAACYKFNNVDKNHADAKALCTSQGGVLPMFRDQNDLDDFRKTMSVSNVFHLGANSIETEGVWVAEHPGYCKPYIPWDAGQPNGGAEKCPILYTNNKVHDYACTSSTSMKVLCQIRLFDDGCQ